MSKRGGYRGYISSRALKFGGQTAQHIQNLVVRDYAGRNKLQLKLSATEYAMPSCYLMLEQVLDELTELDGIILYSVFCLPLDSDRRSQIYQRIFDAGATFHGAAENFPVLGAKDASRLEDIWSLRSLPSSKPFLEEVMGG